MNTKHLPDPDFDRLLTAWFDADAQVREPDTLVASALARSHRSRRRPAWLLPGRWTPMQLTMPLRAAPRFAPMLLPMLALLVAVAVAVVAVGSQPRLPAPFGLAANGHVAYASGGDIYTVDPATGIATAIVTGPETDVDPRFSRDGTHLVFERKEQIGFSPGRLYVVESDGDGLTLVTPGAALVMDPPVISPDGREVMFTSLVDGVSTIFLASSDGSGVRTLDVGIGAYDPDYRAPLGDEIVFAGEDLGQESGLYAVDPVSGARRTILESTNLLFAHVRSSPDGTEIAYHAWGVALGPDDQSRVFITSADGASTRELPTPSDTIIEGIPEWSNDGTRLLVWRCSGPEIEGACDARPAVIPADGRVSDSKLDIEVLAYDDRSATRHWAPDDTSILLSVVDAEAASGFRLIQWDPLTGQQQPVTWDESGGASIQRTAP